MNGKDKCKILKEIRRQIAEANDIEWIVSECNHKGNCKGTCPKCESEVRKLERELSLRSRIGKAVAVTGVSAVCAAGLSACSMEDVIDTGIEIIENINYIRGERETEIRLDGETETLYPIDDDLDGDIIEDVGEVIGPEYIEELAGDVEYCEPEAAED